MNFLVIFHLFRLTVSRSAIECEFFISPKKVSNFISRLCQKEKQMQKLKREIVSFKR